MPHRRTQLLALSVATLLLIPAAGCSGDDAPPPDMKVAPSGPDLPPNLVHGRACDNPGGLCKDKVDNKPLFCIAVQAGGASGRGFCSLECQTPAGRECVGTPNSTWAECLVAGASNDAGTGPMYCAFLCESGVKSYSCPPTLECAPKSSGGKRYCVPKAK